MNYKQFFGAASAALLIVIAVVLVLAPGAQAAGNYKTLQMFTGGKNPTNGVQPWASLISDQKRNLYGTTIAGGNCCGVVFKLTPSSDGTWTESVLYTFCPLSNCSDGFQPFGSLIFDQAGNLYGTTKWGGNLNYCFGSGCGVVFKLTPNSDGSWTESALHSFIGGTDGAWPAAGLIFDQAGNLYGTTVGGNQSYWGNVFELTPNADGGWTEKTLYAFENREQGRNPQAGLIFDQAGNLYGTTMQGGTGCGTVFELTPNSDGSWTEKILFAFTCGKEGKNPVAGLIFDHAGNLYGTTLFGGKGCLSHQFDHCGVVFELTPNTDGSWTEKVLHVFQGGNDGSHPHAGLIFDQAGNLYGTTVNGGNFQCLDPYFQGCGVVFKLTPNSNGGWHETVLHTFSDRPGAQPFAGLTFDSAGNLYGTTEGDGSTTHGTVFEITP